MACDVELPGLAVDFDDGSLAGKGGGAVAQREEHSIESSTAATARESRHGEGGGTCKAQQPHGQLRNTFAPAAGH